MSHSMWASLWAAAALAAASGGATAALPALKPAPQEMKWTTGTEAWLAPRTLTGVSAPAEGTVVAAALERLREKLGTPLPEARQGNLRLVLDRLPATVPARSRSEAYRLVVSARGVVITAETPHGLHHGLVSLAGLVDADGRVPCVTILDWPDLPLRGTYVPGIQEAEARFDQFVALKLNLLLLEDGLLYDLENPAVRARFERFAERCRANFIDFVPELQSLGWGHYVLQREPRAVEAAWVEKAPFEIRERRVHSPDPPLPGPVTVTNGSFEAGLEGWTADSQHGRFIAATPAEVSVVEEGDGHALRLVRTEEGIIRVSQEVAVQANARYELRCRQKTEAIDGGGAYIEVYGVRADGTLGRLIGPRRVTLYGTTDWQETSVIFETGGRATARPGGALPEETVDSEGYQRVCLFLRIQDGTGTAWFDEVSIRPLPMPNPLTNVVVTEAAKVIVQSADGGTTFVEGQDYTLTVPPLRYPFAASPPLGVTLTPDSRIREGDTVLLSYNQAAEGDITCCPSEPLYHDFMRKTVRDVVRTLRPKYLHIGHDEPRFFNRDQRCADREMTNEALFVDDIKRMRDFALDADPNLRVMLWDDAINPYHNARHLKADNAAKLLPRDLIINLWWYDNDQWEEQMDRSLAYFLDLGFPVTGSPWFRVPNAYHWAELFHAAKENPQALGLIYTSWPEVPDPWAALEFTAEHAWSFGKPAYTPSQPPRDP